MAVLESHVELGEEHERRRARMEQLVAELRERTALRRPRRRREGGRAASLARQADGARADRPACRSRQRVPRALALAAWDVYEGQAPSAGIVTGIGVIEGGSASSIANDATVKGGTYFPLTVKKHLRAQEIADQNHLPVRLPRRLGRRLSPAARPRSSPTATTSGRIFYNQARLSAKGIPQIASVMGSCNGRRRPTCQR